MKIRTKMLGPLLGMSLLVAIVGGLAINRQAATARIAATKEAMDVAHALGLALISDSDQLESSAQAVVARLHKKESRDIVLVDTQMRVLADAVPASIGEMFDNKHGEVAATLKDGVARIFVEMNEEHPEGLKQIVAPVQTSSGQMLGAVILEYTPLYEELMQSTRSTVHLLVVCVILSVAMAMWIAFAMGRAIARPLEQLQKAAEGFAQGKVDCSLPPPRNDEIGQLAIAFQNMVEKRQQTEAELRSLRDGLELRVEKRTAELAIANEALQAENAERKRGEETLRESEGKFRQLAENIKDVFYMTSPDLQQVHYVSPAYEQIWGRPAASLYAQPREWIDAILPDEREPARAKLAGLAAGEPSVSVEYQIARPNGDVRWVLNRGFQIRDATDKVIRVMGIVSDITERKLSEAALESVNKELQNSARQAGMAEVATNVLHNVGNVLNSINISMGVVSSRVRKSKSGNVSKVAALLKEHEAGLGDFLSQDVQGRQVPGFLGRLAVQLAEERSTVLEELSSMTKNVDHIKDIVAMQQSYAKVVGVLEPVKLTELVEDSLRMNASALIRHDVHFFREYDDNLPEIMVEKNKVLQILVNLIRNAKQACDQSGRKEKHLTMRITNDSNVARISLTDNGVGIPPENLIRIFNHGFTTKTDGHGFGLHSGALAAQEMGGALRVQSDGVGMGATFTLELPCQAKS